MIHSLFHKQRIGMACLLLALAATATPSPLRAEASAAEKAAAEALFDQGLALLREGRVKEGCVRLEQSQAIERAIGTLLYLAECYEHLGRSASAWALFREAGSAARTARQEERMRIADDRARRLEGTLAKLAIDTEPGAAQRSLEVHLDDIKQPVGLWGVSVPVDPGEHRIVVRAPGYQPWSTVVTLAPSESLTVRIPPLAQESSTPIAPVRPSVPPARAEPATASTTTSTAGAATPAAIASRPVSAPSAAAPVSAPSTAAPVAPSVDRGQRRSVRTRAIAISFGAAGIAAAGVGAFYGARAIHKNDDAEQFCPGGGSVCTDPRGVSLTHDAQRAARIANGLMFGGAGLAAAGLLVYLVRPGDRAPKVALHADARGAALTLRGAF